MRLTDKHYLLKAGSENEFEIPYGDAEIDTPTVPAWFDIDDTDDVLTFTFTEPPEGVFGPYEFGAFKVYIEVLAEVYKEIESCCTNSLSIAWLNIQGGWQNMVFTKKRSLSLESEGSAKTFTIETNPLSQDNLVRYFSELPKKFHGETIFVTIDGQSFFDSLESLKYSIQSYVFNEETQAFDIPIIILQETFPKYDTRKRRFLDFTFSFIYASEIIVQTQ